METRIVVRGGAVMKYLLKDLKITITDKAIILGGVTLLMAGSVALVYLVIEFERRFFPCFFFSANEEEEEENYVHDFHQRRTDARRKTNFYNSLGVFKAFNTITRGVFRAGNEKHPVMKNTTCSAHPWTYPVVSYGRKEDENVPCQTSQKKLLKESSPDLSDFDEPCQLQEVVLVHLFKPSDSSDLDDAEASAESNRSDTKTLDSSRRKNVMKSAEPCDSPVVFYSVNEKTGLAGRTFQERPPRPPSPDLSDFELPHQFQEVVLVHSSKNSDLTDLDDIEATAESNTSLDQ